MYQETYVLLLDYPICNSFALLGVIVLTTYCFNYLLYRHSSYSVCVERTCFCCKNFEDLRLQTTNKS